jgi:hypothetical protein
MTDEQFAARYGALAHAVQSGAAQEQALDDAAVRTGNRSATGVPHSPKMLRTGINMAMVEGGALAQLLIGKGVITMEEYRTALLIGLEREVEEYERRLSVRIGVPVTLG